MSHTYTTALSSLARFSDSAVVDVIQRERYERRQGRRDTARPNPYLVAACDTLAGRGVEVPAYEPPSWAR